jgi:hypothetical protein
MSKRVEYEEPDWLAESPVSETAQQQTLAMLNPDTEEEAYRQASIAAYTAGFFDGEGCVSLNASAQNDCYVDHALEPCLRVALVKHQTVVHGTEKPLLQHLIGRYSEVAGFSYSRWEYEARHDDHRGTEKVHITSAGDIEGFLRPLIPLLYEKRRQALIMVDEILPRYRDGVHHTKRGFVEMMEWKERLDEGKPMDKDDRKYTVEYFEDLWEEDLENQTRLTADDWSADGGNSDD